MRADLTPWTIRGMGFALGTAIIIGLLALAGAAGECPDPPVRGDPARLVARADRRPDPRPPATGSRGDDPGRLRRVPGDGPRARPGHRSGSRRADRAGPVRAPGAARFDQVRGSRPAPRDPVRLDRQAGRLCRRRPEPTGTTGSRPGRRGRDRRGRGRGDPCHAPDPRLLLARRARPDPALPAGLSPGRRAGRARGTRGTKSRRASACGSVAS